MYILCEDLRSAVGECGFKVKNGAGEGGFVEIVIKIGRFLSGLIL